MNRSTYTLEGCLYSSYCIFYGDFTTVELITSLINIYNIKSFYDTSYEFVMLTIISTKINFNIIPGAKTKIKIQNK